MDRRPLTPAPRRARGLLGLLVALAVLGALLIALVGAWVGTTLAVYRAGPVWLVVVGAVTCFALLPLAWELLADRHQVGGRVRDTILRSAALSLGFLVVLLATHPKVAFEALATRGDWFLGGARGGVADVVRDVLHTTADGLEWLNDLVREKAFRVRDDDPEAVTAARDGHAPVPPPAPSSAASSSASDASTAPAADAWPLPAVVHPAVVGMPASARASLAAVGQWLAAEVRAPRERVKAIHDFVATWVAYDAEGLASGAYRERSQAAADVFARRTAVCEGYARLVAALGKVTGDEIVVVSGDARTRSDYDGLAVGETPPASSAGHAWNAARIDGEWVLLDATWDAGTVSGERFEPRYRTDFLFMPPAYMIASHRPDNDDWQLLATPLTRGEWLRQPLYQPLAFVHQLTLVAPSGPMTSADGALTVTIDNPREVYVWLAVAGPGAAAETCGEPQNAARAVLTCPIPAEGRGHALVFVAPRRHTTFETALSLVVDGTD